MVPDVVELDAVVADADTDADTEVVEPAGADVDADAALVAVAVDGPVGRVVEAEAGVAAEAESCQ